MSEINKISFHVPMKYDIYDSVCKQMNSLNQKLHTFNQEINQHIVIFQGYLYDCVMNIVPLSHP